MHRDEGHDKNLAVSDRPERNLTVDWIAIEKGNICVQKLSRQITQDDRNLTQNYPEKKRQNQKQY